MKTKAFLMLIVTFSACQAQVVPPNQAPVAILDPSMVLNDRGMKIEVYPTSRVALKAERSGKAVIQSVQTASATTPVSAEQMGVLFNHAMQQYGYFAGEIAFKLKSDLGAGQTSDLAALPGFARMGKANLFVVRARSSLEFAQLVSKLNGRVDIEWVEPTILYGPPPSVQSPVR